MAILTAGLSISANHPGEQATHALRTSASGQHRDADGKSGAIYMGDLDLGQDPIQSKLNAARKQAYKLVSDAWGADRDLESRLRELRSFISEQRSERDGAKADGDAAREAIAAIHEEYQVDPDSQEQKDLDWLMAYNKKPMTEKMRDPEQFKQDQAHKTELMANLTEYQSRMLDADDRLTDANARYRDAEDRIRSARQSLTDAESERRKQHTMVDAQRDGDAILAAAEKDVIGIVMSDAKDNLDEKVREEQEKKEEKKEEEEKAKDIEEKRAEREAVYEAVAEGAKDAVLEAKERVRESREDDLDLSDLVDMDPQRLVKTSDNVDAALDELKSKMQLIDADLKGLKVDETV